MARLTEPSKHTVYYELLDACTKGGCPICTMALATVERYLDTVIYENVNDSPTREGVIAARGYCNDHSWQVRDTQGGSALGMALMYRDVLRHVDEEIGSQSGHVKLDLFTEGQGSGGLLDRLTSLTGSAESNGRRQSVSDPHVACPACQVRARFELIYLGTLLEHLDEETFAQALRAAGGLCLVHLDQASTATRDTGALKRLLEIQHACMRALNGELSEFIRKNDYRFAREGMGTEGNSWIRAIEMVAGKRGIR